MLTITFIVQYLDGTETLEIINNVRSNGDGWHHLVARLTAYEHHAGKLAPSGISNVALIIRRIDEELTSDVKKEG